MARRYGTVTTEGDIALAAATPKTVLQVVAPSNQDVPLRGFSIAGDGVSGTGEPFTVELVIQSDAGTSSVATPVKDNQQHGAIQTTARKNCTAEPTTTDVLRRYSVHPQDGIERVFGGPGDEITVVGGTRLGIRCTLPTGATAINVSGHIAFEE